MDATSSNAWDDPAKGEATFTQSDEMSEKAFAWKNTLPPNSVTLTVLSKRRTGADSGD